MLGDSIAVAGASAEPVPPSEGTAKTEAKAVSASGKKSPWLRRRSSVATAAVTRARNLPEGAERSSIPIRSPCARITRKSERGEREPTQNSTLGVGHQPTQANTRDRRGRGAKPAGPDEEDTAIFHRDEPARSSPVVFRGRLWQTGQEIIFPWALLYSRM